MKPFLLILSAPTGAGKTTIAKRLVQTRPDRVAFSVSATTRPPRPGEKDGIDYFFISRAEFLRRRDAGELLEWAEYSGNLYGTPVSEVERILRSGRYVLLDIEVQGTRQIRARRSDVVSVFVLPPGLEVLLQRLRGRGSEAPRELRPRLEQAVQELEAVAEYDYVVVNDEREQAVRDVAAILDAESIRCGRRDDILRAARELQDALRRAAAEMSG